MTVLASDWYMAPHAALSLARPDSGRGSVNSTICKKGRQRQRQNLKQNPEKLRQEVSNTFCGFK